MFLTISSPQSYDKLLLAAPRRRLSVCDSVVKPHLLWQNKGGGVVRQKLEKYASIAPAILAFIFLAPNPTLGNSHFSGTFLEALSPELKRAGSLVTQRTDPGGHPQGLTAMDAPRQMVLESKGCAILTTDETCGRASAHLTIGWPSPVCQSRRQSCTRSASTA